MRRRLTPEDWILAAIEGLLKNGAQGVRIAYLARELGVTPGSFYWHFLDRDQFRDQVVQHWMKQMIARAASAAENAGKGPERIRALPDILVEAGLPDYDTAMRAWALAEPVVARAVVQADELRLRRLAGMLEEAGFSREDAELFAQTLLWTFLGSVGSDPELRLRAFKELIEALLARR